MLNSNFETHCIMNKIINAIIALVCIGLFVACEDDQSYNENGVGREFTIGADTQFSGVESRAIFESGEVNITNYVFLLYGYDENVREATLLFSNEYTSLPVVERLPLPDVGEKYHAIMIANTTVAQLESLGITANSTLEKLFSATFDINTTDNKPTNAQKFTWSGYKEVLPDTRHLHFSLNPNLAKITVSVTDKSTDNYVINVQVRNVPNKARFAQNALSKAGFFKAHDNATGVTDWIDYDIEELTLTKNTAKSISWYLPHNEYIADGNRSTNPVKVPSENVTYVEVDGFRTIDYLDTAYKIYPGTDSLDSNGNKVNVSYKDLKNFRIKADYQYKVTMSISNDGITYQTAGYNTPDLGGIDVDRVILPEGANCYMIHPKFSNSAGGTVYELPAWQRINEYWGNNWGISGVGDASNVISDNTEWEMHVIWQDINAEALYFCDENGNIANGSGQNGDYLVVTGKKPAYFKLNYDLIVSSNVFTGDTSKDIYGNILVGVKKKGAASDGAWLWSWHLWLTEYNPDVAPVYNISATDNSKVYLDGAALPNLDYQGYDYWTSGGYNQSSGAYSTPVYGNTGSLNWSNVQHLYNFGTTYWNPNTKSAALWDTGIYKNKWMMDRNVGSQSPNSSNIKNPVDGFGMFYQYGRKDPIPYTGSGSYKLYKRNGRDQVTLPSSLAGNVTMNVGVQNPTQIYHNDHNGGHHSWTSCYSATYNNPWYCPYSVSKGKKTLFDPCPPGWCLPVIDTFDYAYYNNGLYEPSNTGATTTANLTYGNVYLDVASSTGTSANLRDNLRHFALIEYHRTQALYNADPVDCYFPIQGFISPNYGVLRDPTYSASDKRSYMWFCDGALSNGYVTGVGYGFAGTMPAKFANSAGWNSGRYRKIYGRAFYTANFGGSRGHNVRCIQIPD